MNRLCGERIATSLRYVLGQPQAARGRPPRSSCVELLQVLVLAADRGCLLAVEPLRDDEDDQERRP